LVKNSKAGLLVNKINSLLLFIIKGLMNNSFYQVIPLEKTYF